VTKERGKNKITASAMIYINNKQPRFARI